MTPAQRMIGFTATLAIAVILLAAIAGEPARQEDTRAAHIAASIDRVIDVYAYNCVECHGPAGQGYDINPALNDEVASGKDALQLYRTIERGREGTDMAAFGINEGGILTVEQINGLVALVQYGGWDRVAARVAALGLMPTATFTPTVTPSATATATATLTPTITASVTATVTPSQTRTPSPTTTTDGSGGVSPFAVVPTSTPEGGSTGGGASPFAVVPTSTPEGGSTGGGVSPFAVVPTSTPEGGSTGGGVSPFAVVPTATSEGG